MESKIHRRIETTWKINIEYSESVEEEDKSSKYNKEMIDLEQHLKNFKIFDDVEDQKVMEIAARAGCFLVTNKKIIIGIVFFLGFASSVITIFQFLS